MTTRTDKTTSTRSSGECIAGVKLQISRSEAMNVVSEQ